MTRSKAIVIRSAIEEILLLAFILLGLFHAIGLTLFIAWLIGFGAVSTFYIWHVMRSLPPGGYTQV